MYLRKTYINGGFKINYEKVGLNLRFVKDYFNVVFLLFGGFMVMDYLVLGNMYTEIKQDVLLIIMVFVLMWQIGNYNGLMRTLGFKEVN